MSRKAPISNGKLIKLLGEWEFESTGRYVGDHQVFEHKPTGKRVHAIAAPLGRAAPYEAIRKAAEICGVLQKTFLQGPPRARRPAHRETSMVGRQRSQIRGYLLRRAGNNVTADEVVRALGSNGRTARASIISELVNLSRPPSGKPDVQPEIKKTPDTVGVYQVPFNYLSKVVEINRAAERAGRALVPIPPELRERAREIEAELGAADAAADPTPAMTPTTTSATVGSESTQEESVPTAVGVAGKNGDRALIRGVLLHYRGLTVTIDQILKELGRTSDDDRRRLGQNIGGLVRQNEVFSNRSPGHSNLPVGHYKVPTDYLQTVLALNARNRGTSNPLVEIPNDLLNEPTAPPTPASPPVSVNPEPTPTPTTEPLKVKSAPPQASGTPEGNGRHQHQHRQTPPVAEDDGLRLIEQIAVIGNQHLWRDADGNLWVAYPARIAFDT